MRLLAASGPLMQPGFPQGIPRPVLTPGMAAATGMDQAAQFSQALRAQAMMCQNMPEMTPELLARTQMMMEANGPGLHFPPGYPYMYDGGRRKNATREITQSLKDWLNVHKKNPYPSKPEKIMLALATGMTLTQVGYCRQF